MTLKTDSLQRKISLDTPFLSLFTLNWELILYVTFFVIAIITRFYIWHAGDEPRRKLAYPLLLESLRR